MLPKSSVNFPKHNVHGAKHLEQKLGIHMGQTTKDGMFTLQQSECLGACADSPVMLVNDRSMCSNMSNDKIDQLIDGLRKAERPTPAAPATFLAGAA